VSGTAVSPKTRAPRRAWLARPRVGLVAVGRGLELFALMIAGLGPVLAVTLIVAYFSDIIRWLANSRLPGPSLSTAGGVPFLVILATLLYFRPLVNLMRRLTARWCGVSIERPYRPGPDSTGLGLGEHARRRLRWILTDPATWRDLLWLAVNATVGTVLIAAPAVMICYGLVFAVLPTLGVAVSQLPHVGFLVAKGPGALPLGLVLIAAGLWAAPPLLTGYGWLARLILGSNKEVELTAQIRHLTQTRSDFIDSGAAELRRIERDLHDGAQARLVAMGMTLDAIDQQLETSPDAARALLAEAKASSVRALAELRDLVRGIHPPVLADRGLAEAVRALALDSPQRVRFTGELPSRPPGPVESAAYFAVSELLANVSKHAAAREAWIDIRHSGGVLRISVGDNGHGGADPAKGSGLRGIERRLGAFDGVVAVSSPQGGPTVVNMEIPCALS
jgi:signal transduction histidine kinase